MAQTFLLLFKEARPRQWLKNATLFTAIFFTGQLFNFPLLTKSFGAFISFCAASSALYIFNDLQDISQDREHPFKKRRPLASGKLSKKTAVTGAIVLASAALFLAMQISPAFLTILLAFAALHISYSLYLKHIILLDILAIAGSFILRVFAGEVASGFHIDIWLFLTVISAALFLAIGKRRSELTLLSGWNGTIPVKVRATLSHYSEKMLDVYIAMFANSTWITYAFYTFLQQPPVLRRTFTSFIEQYNLDSLYGRKWLMLTIPFVIYGIMRYLQLIYEKNEGESPEKVLLSDRPLIITASILGLMLLGILYVVGK